MKKKTFLFVFLLQSIFTFAQKELVSFDLIHKTVDTIPIVSYDTTVKAEHTSFNVGNYNSNVTILESIPPTINTYPNSQFTYKKKAEIDFILDDYPMRTSVQLMYMYLDTMRSFCSGSIISERHVLSAAHCIAPKDTSMLFDRRDSMYVCPVRNNGNEHPDFGCVRIQKATIIKDWNFFGEDLTLLTLNEPIGIETGWLGFGFNENDTALKDGIFYKFSYPGIYFPQIDSNVYNGDTLYYNYGVTDFTDNNYIGIQSASGIPGESGSSLVKVDNSNEYTSYGVLTLSNGLRHSRIKNWQFYAFKDIIEKDILLTLPKEKAAVDFSIYPNPTEGILNVKIGDQIQPEKIWISDQIGRTIQFLDVSENPINIRIDSYQNGVYFFSVQTKYRTYTKKFVKY